jgi:hypothetical protein
MVSNRPKEQKKNSKVNLQSTYKNICNEYFLAYITILEKKLLSICLSSYYFSGGCRPCSFMVQSIVYDPRTWSNEAVVLFKSNLNRNAGVTILKILLRNAHKLVNFVQILAKWTRTAYFKKNWTGTAFRCVPAPPIYTNAPLKLFSKRKFLECLDIFGKSAS